MKITEHNYGMPREAYYGTIFSQSNGYMGVRASFEENGSLGVQGAFIRGKYTPFGNVNKCAVEIYPKFLKLL